MLARLKHLPAPLAAPETPGLRRARIRVIAASALLAAICLFFAPMREVAGRYALPIAGALLVFLAVQIPLWLHAKNRADDAFLMSGRDG